MKVPKVIQVFEYETLKVGTLGFTKDHFDLMSAYIEGRKPKYFKLGHQSIRFTSYVGVIQVDDLVIEVLPKADKNKADKDTALWRDVLLDMLKISGFINVKSASEASLRLRGGTLFNLFFEIYLSCCRNILNQGLVRRYNLETCNRSVLKGRLLFSEQLKHNLVRKERFFTSSQEYTTDNTYNQILFKALKILSTVSTSSAQRSDAAFMLQQNESIADLHCTPDTFSRLKYGRTTERYRSALRIAELIILNYRPDIKSGHRSVFAMLFKMEALFESYVLQVLKKAARRTEFKISAQTKKGFWSGENTKSKGVKPDIIINFATDAKERRVVLDTKWKLPGDHLPTDSDLKQMFVYNKIFKAESSNLVYPAVDSDSITKTKGWFKGKDNGGCSMWFIPILNLEEGKLNDKLGERILDQVRESYV